MSSRKWSRGRGTWVECCGTEAMICWTRGDSVWGGGWHVRVHCAPDVQMLYNNEGLMEIHKLHTPHTSKLSIQAYAPPPFPTTHTYCPTKFTSCSYTTITVSPTT